MPARAAPADTAGTGPETLPTGIGDSDGKATPAEEARCRPELASFSTVARPGDVGYGVRARSGVARKPARGWPQGSRGPHNCPA